MKFLLNDLKESETPTPPAVNSPNTVVTAAAAQSPALPQQQQFPPDVPSTPPPLIPANLGKEKTLHSHYK